MKTGPVTANWKTMLWLLAVVLPLFFAVMFLALSVNAQQWMAGNASPITTAVKTVSYAIVDTGQTRCYNTTTEIPCPAPGAAFYGQDAQYTGHAPSYTLSTNGVTVYDNVTGLTWEGSPVTTSDSLLTKADKLTYANVQRAANYVRLVRDVEQEPVTGYTIYLPIAVKDSENAGGFTIEQTLSDGAQRNTIAFDALSFLTGNLGADSFFPPGKVADFWGFQYLRDNDPTEMGHNTDFLTRAALNMLHVLTSAQRDELIAMAESQVDDINQYAYDRFVLMDAFRRLLESDLPPGSTGLDAAAVQAYSAELYRLDSEISYERARVMGGQLSKLDASQQSYLDAMVGQGMLTWPVVDEPEELRGLAHDVKVAVMTYAGDMFSWYAGSIEADVYFCPERQGTYFGSFYMKDAPAVGNPGYSIPITLTAELGAEFLQILTPDQADLITSLVDDQKPALYEIVDRREDVSVLLRQFMAGGMPDQNTVLNLMGRYGELDGEIVYRYATAFAQVAHTLTAEQRAQLLTLRTDLLGELAYPAGAYLYSQPIPMPEIPNTDFLFTTD